MKNVVVVVGTRPEAIKLAPVIFALRSSSFLRPQLLSTGQHREMLSQALTDFGLVADYDLGLMREDQSLSSLTSRAIEAVSCFIDDQQPAAIVVQGDTSTVLATALAGFFADIPIAHVEAGLRSGNIRSPFPEEMNRRLVSPLAKWHFCPTALAKQNLIDESIPSEACFVTGNTVVDALLWMRKKQDSDGILVGELAERLGIDKDFSDRYLVNGAANKSRDAPFPFILVTGHRRESFGEGFERICRSINELTRKYPDLGVLYPVHLNPRVQGPVRKILGKNPSVQLCSPANYKDFVWLMHKARLILSDSGGIQEEAPSLGKPVLVMRENTERPEGVLAGSCRLVGTDPEKILNEVSYLLDDSSEYTDRSKIQNPYGDGKSSIRIKGILEEYLK